LKNRVAITTHLWGYSAIGNSTVTVQEPPRFLQNKSQEKFRRRKLSNSVQNEEARIASGFTPQ
jgi:hypothetical protein